MSKKHPLDDMDELPTVPSLELGRVTGGAGMDMTSMAMMMMAMKSKGAGPAPAAAPPPPQAPKLMVDGVAQQLQSDGQGGYIVNDDESGAS